RPGLLFLRRLDGFDDFEWDATAVTELIAVVLGPFADLRRVPLGTCRTAAAAAASGVGYATRFGDEWGESLAELLGILGREFEFVGCLVQAEANGFCRFGSVEIICENEAHFPCHVHSFHNQRSLSKSS